MQVTFILIISIERKQFSFVSFGLCVSVCSHGYTGIPLTNVTGFVLVV